MSSEPKRITVRLALVCGECGADMSRADATDEVVIYRCDGPYHHEYRQLRKVVRYRSTQRNNEPDSAA